MNTRSLTTICSGLILLAATSKLAAQSTVVELRPAQDTHLRDSNVNTNFGSSDVLWIGRGSFWGLGNVRTLLAFDLTKLPADPERIQSATLSAYQHNSEPAAGGLTNQLHRLTAPWDEATATWANQPGFDPRVWGDARVGDSRTRGWIDWDATGLVREHAGGTANLGWMLKMQFETAGASRLGYFHSREYTIDPDLRPKLRIVLHDLKLRVGNLNGGQRGRLIVSGAGAGDVVLYFFSTTGLGDTPVPPLNVSLGLDAAALWARKHANGKGVADLSRKIPRRASGSLVWIQAATRQHTSNVVATTVN